MTTRRTATWRSSSRTCACRRRTCCSARAGASRSRRGGSGPGRIHHCMRTIGAAEEALDAMVKRLMSRTAFGKTLAEQGVWEERIADARIDIEMTRLLCLKAADMMDRAGNKAAQGEIAMIKVAAPLMALKIIDDAIQAFGGAGVSDDVGPGPRLCARSARCGSPTAPTRSTAARSPGWSSRSTGERVGDRRGSARALARGQCRGLHRPVRADEIPVGPVEPDLPHPRRVGRLCPSAQAVRAASARPPTRSIANIGCFRRFIRWISPCRSRSPCAPTRTSSARSST